jgi:hypothetical protein
MNGLSPLAADGPDGWHLALTCPYDGAPIEPVASGCTNGWETRAVARCTACGTQLLLAVTATAPNGRRRTTPARRHQLEHARSMRAT